MGNMSSFCDSAVKKATLEFWSKRRESDAERKYLGASAIGHECDKYLWLSFRGAFNENFEPRMYRLFDRGAREEQTFTDELRGAGCEVWDVNPNTGFQFAVSALGGHFSGHLDGVGKGVPGAEKTPHVLEYKTHSDSSFSKLVKEGVEVSKYRHYAQMQVYMGLMKVTRALYCAVNKNTDETYFERIEFNPSVFKSIMARAERIITANDAERCATRPDDWRCKMCSARAVCWRETGTVLTVEKERPIDCRTCCHATPNTKRTGAIWTCSKGLAVTTGKACGCKSHVALPSLVDAELQGATEDGLSAIYKIDGAQFINGVGQFSSEELQRCPPSVTTAPPVNIAKACLGATIEKVERITLQDKYPATEKNLVWTGDKASVREAFMKIKFDITPKITETVKDDESEYFEYNESILVCISKLGDFASIFRR